MQHAHHKGIIHRDLKPSNILIALYDGEPVPKVIDFGVAKALHHELTEKTVFTQYGQIVGTLEYMSPEQAQLNQLDIDTRSDIYSMGVLLYELLTGTTPFEKKRLRSAAFDELLRIIREEEPPRPSQRLSTSETLASVAANRHTEPKKLHRLVRGELDWIVMTALEKDRARRYETANGFAEDIQRYLDNEAVMACPPSAAYRFRKFARRNRGFVIAASTVTAALLIGLAAALTGFVFVVESEKRAVAKADDAEVARSDAEKQRNLAVKEAEKAQLMSRTLTELLSTTFPTVERGPGFTVRDMLDEFVMDNALSDYPEIEGDVLYTLGFTYRRLGLRKQAESHLGRALQLRRNIFGNEHEKVAECLRTLSRVTKDITQAREALQIQRRLGKHDESICKTLTWMCWHLNMEGRGDEAEATLVKVEEKCRELDMNGEVAWALMARGDIRATQGDFSIAESKYPEIVSWPEDDRVWTRAWATLRVGRMLLRQGKTADADTYFQRLRMNFKKYKDNWDRDNLILQRKTDLGEIRHFGDPSRFARPWQDREVTTWMWMPYGNCSRSWISF